MASNKKKFKKYIRIPLILTATNHLEIKAALNGVPGRFILDTGASNTCVGLDKIEFFDLVSEDSEIKAAGAGATNMLTQISAKNKIMIGKWKMKKFKLVVFDLSHVNEALTSHDAEPVDGIIGADILKKGKAIIDYGQECVYLKKKKSKKKKT